MPLSTLAATVSPAGISAPDFAAILLSLQESVQAIYGADVYIAPDSQDGQLLAIVASAINDANNMAIAVYECFSPSTAQGVPLSSVVKINGIARIAASFSTAVGTIVGQVGTVIVNGVVSDVNGVLWSLPVSVTIPDAGEIDVTVTAQTAGATPAQIGDINQIYTPVAGWQTFVNTTTAVPGVAVETDFELRNRQTVSVALPALTPLDSLYAALANLAGVGRLKVYENDTGAPDANGIPAHNISVVVSGGDLVEIATTIGQEKTPGAGTYGSTSQNYSDPVTGINYTINFYVLTFDTIKVDIVGVNLGGYNSIIETELKQSIADYINGLDIGADVIYSRLWGPAYINGTADGQTYEITALQIAKNAGPLGVIDLAIAFNKAAVCDPDADITVTI